MLVILKVCITKKNYEKISLKNANDTVHQAICVIKSHGVHKLRDCVFCRIDIVCMYV